MRDISKYLLFVYVLIDIIGIDGIEEKGEVIREDRRPNHSGKPESGSSAPEWSRPPQWEPFPEWTPPPVPKPLDCEEEIYCKCHTKNTFSAQELENVKTYLQYKWYYEASVKPLREPCKQIYVRQNWKCLSDEMKQRYVRAFRVLHERGVMNALGELHGRWWAAGHKSPDFTPFHVYISLAAEWELWKVDPTLPGLPYWDYIIDWAQPHKSCVWKDFGWGGIYRNGYCVRNGNIFGGNLAVDFHPRCLKREWRNDGTLSPLSPAEMQTSWIQVSKNVSQIGQLLGGFHFFHHVTVGGWNGDKSHVWAAHDVAFILSHNAEHKTGFAWRLQDPARLTPVDQYAAPPQVSIDSFTGQIQTPNIYDRLVYTNRSLLEYYQMGYGDQCYVYDSFVEPINRLVMGEPPLPPPNTVQRLIDTLPADMLKKYYPLFAAGNTDFTTYIADYMPECNANCHPMPFFQRYNETGTGRIGVLQPLRFAQGIDANEIIQESQRYYWDFMVDHNSVRYCSPTVNTLK